MRRHTRDPPKWGRLFSSALRRLDDAHALVRPACRFNITVDTFNDILPDHPNDPGKTRVYFTYAD
jgi:hypothetical protein